MCNLWPTSVLHAAVGWLWVVKRRDYTPIRMTQRREARVKGRRWVKNVGRVRERIRDFSRPYLLTYVYLAAYLAMPLSIISCYLGEVLQPPFNRELSERASNQPSNNTTTIITVTTTTALLDVAQPRLPSRCGVDLGHVHTSLDTEIRLGWIVILPGLWLIITRGSLSDARRRLSYLDNK